MNYCYTLSFYDDIVTHGFSFVFLGQIQVQFKNFVFIDQDSNENVGH